MRTIVRWARCLVALMTAFWTGFILLVLALLALDLGVLNRKAHRPSLKEALGWTAGWVTLGVLFSGVVYYMYEHKAFGMAEMEVQYTGTEAMLTYLMGFVLEESLSIDNLFVMVLIFRAYRVPGQFQHRVLFWGILGAIIMRAGMILGGVWLIEKALSVDNIFVFVLIFSSFRVPSRYQHRVLFWGILGALLMRGAMIAAGAYLIQQFHWIIYIFGAFLVFTGIRTAMHVEHDFDSESSLPIRLIRRLVPVTDGYHGQRFFIREQGHRRSRLLATPLFVVLVLVETTDLIFAVDSIPAIFAVTQEPFIVYSSNVFAILGLRALYFLLADVIHRFHYLKAGLSTVLVFVGLKMLAIDVYKVPVGMSLGIIATVLGVSIAASWFWPRPAAGDVSERS